MVKIICPKYTTQALLSLVSLTATQANVESSGKSTAFPGSLGAEVEQSPNHGIEKWFGHDIGDWGPWSDWTPCAGGEMHRFRECNPIIHPNTEKIKRNSFKMCQFHPDGSMPVETVTCSIVDSQAVEEERSNEFSSSMMQRSLLGSSAPPPSAELPPVIMVKNVAGGLNRLEPS